MLDHLICVDQRAASNLVSEELLMRRRALIREAHRIFPTNPDYSGPGRFMGWVRRRGGASIDPSRSKHVSEQLQREAAIAKESRKAREERALRINLKTDGGGSPGPPNPKGKGKVKDRGVPARSLAQ